MTNLYKLAVAECATGGNLMTLITSKSGASKYYLGGINTYTISSKVKYLNVNESEAIEDKCVSERIVKQMAKGVSHMFMSDIGISTTGYAEKTEQFLESYIYFCIYNKQTDKYYVEKIINKHNLPRIEFQKYVSSYILNIFDKNYKIIYEHQIIL